MVALAMKTSELETNS